MYTQVGDFRVSRGPPTVPLTQILCNTFFFKSQNPRNAGTLCTLEVLFPLEVVLFLEVLPLKGKIRKAIICGKMSTDELLTRMCYY